MENNDCLTIEKLAPLIRTKALSPVELTRFLLDRISLLQPTINAYITVAAETALAQARQAEREITKGRYKGVLHGIPIGIKDLIHTRNIRTTAGSRILKGFFPKKNAEVVERLLHAGCVLLGKTNLHEFAYGPTNINPHYGPVYNPWDTDRISGGSSGGSAAAVVSAQAIAALGTDTGGSIRIPSAACGCVGFKPSFGWVPLDGVIPLAFSLDHVGPLSRCVMDAAFLFEAISRPAGQKSRFKRVLPQIRKGVKSLRIGVPRKFFFERVQPEVRKTVLAAVAEFEKLGAEILQVNLRGMQKTTAIAAEVTGDEALAFHAGWLDRRPQDYGKDVRIRLGQSRKATAVAYIRARQDMTAYGRRLAQALDSVHLLIAPSLPILTPRFEDTVAGVGRSGEDIRTALLRLTRPANLSGLPAISIPCGFSSRGLPIGLQLIGRALDEGTLLRAAYAYEKATPWHRQFPSDDVSGTRSPVPVRRSKAKT